MTTLQATLLIEAVPLDICEQLRRTDDAGRPPVLSVDETGGAPLRCCLTRALPGDRIALLCYAPLRRWAAETGADPGPYDEQGPIFIHAEECAGAPSGWPDAYHNGPRVLRAYDSLGRILRGVPVEPAEAESASAELLADRDVAVVHVRAVGFGCFLHAVRRG